MNKIAFFVVLLGLSMGMVVKKNLVEVKTASKLQTGTSDTLGLDGLKGQLYNVGANALINNIATKNGNGVGFT